MRLPSRLILPIITCRRFTFLGAQQHPIFATFAKFSALFRARNATFGKFSALLYSAYRDLRENTGKFRRKGLWTLHEQPPDSSQLISDAQQRPEPEKFTESLQIHTQSSDW